MANKYYGIVGFVRTEEDEDKPGKWVKNITEKHYYMDVSSVGRRRDTDSKVNDDFVITNRFSLVMDPFVRENFRTIAYVEYMGTKWKISNADVMYPRLMLTLGGEYNA